MHIPKPTTILELAKKNEQYAQKLQDAKAYKEAIEPYQRAAEYYAQLNLWSKKWYCQIKAIELLFYSYNWTQAQDLIQDILKEIEEHNATQTSEYAFALCINASLFLHKSQFNDALNYYLIALQIIQKEHKNTTFCSKILSNIGNVYTYKGYYEQAIKYFLKAIKIKEEVFPTTHPSLAITYNNLASVYQKTEDYYIALQYFQKSLNIKLGNYSPTDLTIAMLYNNIGTVYSLTKDYKKALSYYQQALDIYTITNKKINTYAITTHFQLSNTYVQHQQYDKAIQACEQAIDIAQKLHEQPHIKILVAYLQLGHAYKGKKEYVLALNSYEQALDFAHQIYGDKNPYISEIHINKALIYKAQNKHLTALNLIQLSICKNIIHFDNKDVFINPSLEGSFDRKWLLQSLYHKAKLLYLLAIKNKDQQFFEKSYETYVLCDQLIDQIRHKHIHYNDQLYLSKEVLDIYEGALELCYSIYKQGKDAQYIHKAFYFSEKSKNAALRNTIANVKALTYGDIPSDLLQEEKQLKIDIVFYQQQIYHAKLNNKQEKLHYYEALLNSLNIRYHQLIEQLEQKYKKYYKLKYSHSIISIPNLQNILSNDTKLISYFVGKNYLYAFFISKKYKQFYQLPKKESFQSQIKSLCNYFSLFSSSNVNFQQQGVDYQKYASELQQFYTDILAPILASPIANRNSLFQQFNPPKVSKLIIIPDDLLNFIPFDALLTEAPKHVNKFNAYPYLLKKYAISYAPCATLFAQKNNYFFKNNEKLLLIAPNFNSKNKKSNTNKHTSSLQFTPLPFNKIEINNIQHFFEHTLLIDQEATKKNFLQYAPNYSLIHISSHAKANHTVPKQSLIAFSPSSDKTGEKCNLYLSEIYNLSLPTKLMVLSACETGLGKLQQGEGIINFARAFTYAGVQSLCITLWSINAQTTAKLMKYFYNYLSKGIDKSVALQKAKLTYIENSPSELTHPFFWAAYIIVGKTEPIFQKKIKKNKEA